MAVDGEATTLGPWKLSTWIAIGVLVVGLITVALALTWAYQELSPASPEAQRQVDVEYETPEETVAAYYDALAKGDKAVGAALVAPQARAAIVDNFTSDFGNISALTKFEAQPAKTVPPAPAASPSPTPTPSASGTASPKPASPTPTAPAVQTVTVDVTYTVDYTNQITGNDGPVKRVVILSRASDNDQWRIVAIRPRA